jgi:hypothetical protein
MSKRYPGGLITKTPVVPTTTAASGVWTLDQAITYIQAGTWPVQPNYFIGTLGGGSSVANAGYSITTDSSNNLYFCGLSQNPSYITNFEIAKYNIGGNIQWQRTLSTTNAAASITSDSSNNLYVVGASQVGSVNYIQLAKYDSSGTIQWQNTLGAASDSSGGYGIAVDSSNNVYVGGYSSVSFSRPSYHISKYNSSGTIQWQRRLQGSYADYVYGIAVDPSGNVYVTGSNQGPLSGSDALTAKYNTSGTLQWQTFFNRGASFQTKGYAIAVDSSGNSYICGFGVTATGTRDMFIYKVDTSGTVVWGRNFTNTSTQLYGQGIAIDSSGNVYAIGYTTTPSSLIQIVKYDNSGTIQWQRQITQSSSSMYGLGIKIDSLGNMCIIGYYNLSSSYILFARLPSNGSLTGTYTVNGASFVYSASTFIDSAGPYSTGAGTLTAGTPTLTSATSSLTDSASTLTSSVTTL